MPFGNIQLLQSLSGISFLFFNLEYRILCDSDSVDSSAKILNEVKEIYKGQIM